MGNILCFKNQKVKVSKGNDIKSKYTSHNFNNTSASLVKDRSYYVRFVDIYDADTLTCIVEVFPSLFQKITIRIIGIDACEMTSKNSDAKDYALRARNRVINFLTNNNIQVSNSTKRSQIRELLDNNIYLIYVKFLGQDKYGRTLGDVYLNENSESISNILLNEKMAIPYSGGKRLDDLEQLKKLNG